jgi:transcription antitermination factor NusG
MEVRLLNVSTYVGIVGLANIFDEQDQDLSTAATLPAAPSTASMVGEVVQVMSGPLKGLQGTCIESRSMCRSIISVEVAGRLLCVELHDDWLGLVSDSAARHANIEEP